MQFQITVQFQNAVLVLGFFILVPQLDQFFQIEVHSSLRVVFENVEIDGHEIIVTSEI